MQIRVWSLCVSEVRPTSLRRQDNSRGSGFSLLYKFQIQNKYKYKSAGSDLKLAPFLRLQVLKSTLVSFCAGSTYLPSFVERLFVGWIFWCLDLESKSLFDGFQAKLIPVDEPQWAREVKGEFRPKPAVAGLSAIQLCGLYAVTTLCQLRRVQAGGCLRRAGWTSKSTSLPLSPPLPPSWPPPPTPTSRGPPSSASTKTQREYRLVFIPQWQQWEEIARKALVALKPTDTPSTPPCLAIWPIWGCSP